MLLDWDGAPLEENALVDLEFDTECAGALQTVAAPTQPPRTFEEAVVSVSRSNGGIRGILIEGPAGSGKSVLSHALVRNLQSWATGARIVRCASRDIASAAAAAVATGSSPIWPSAEGERVALIVDGLDELTGPQFTLVVSVLRRAPAWWIATTRPLDRLRRLPAAWLIRIRPLTPAQGKKLLRARGRADLAISLYEAGTRDLDVVSTSPLLLALLTRVIRVGEAIHSLTIHDIYERLFDALLEQAIHSGRLSEVSAQRLDALREAVVGELALTWIRTGAPLDRTRVTSVLEQAGFRGSDLVDLAVALEFGHLLVPAGDGWDFAHRTVAEWIGAVAVHRRVVERLKHAEREKRGRLLRTERAHVEGEELDTFLHDDGQSRSAWQQLLRFYAPFVEEPLALLDAIAGVRARDTWPPRVADVLEEWEFAWEIAALVKWARPSDACIAWAIEVRFSLLELRTCRSHPWPPPVSGLAAAVAEHLPQTMPELIALASRDRQQRAQLQADPMQLLSALTSMHAHLTREPLRQADRDQQQALLKWHRARNAPADPDLLTDLIRVLPEEVASNDRLEALETLVWDLAVDANLRTFWQAARPRLETYPAHLVTVIFRWFTLPREGEPLHAEESDRERRNLLASSIDNESTWRTENLLRILHSSRVETVAGELFASLSPESANWQALIAAMDRADCVPLVATAAVAVRRAAISTARRAKPTGGAAYATAHPALADESDPVAARFDKAEPDLRVLVDLAFDLISGDLHHVYSVPSALGSDFDEPADLDWYSQDGNAVPVAAAKRKIREALKQDPAAWPEVRKLLSHPSQSLRLVAFEFCADLCRPDEILGLAIDALDQHIRHDRTRFSGRTMEFWLAGQSRGAGHVHVEVVDARSAFIRAVRRRLTPAHRDVVETLARHELPTLRGLAAAWCAELGSPTWLEILSPLLSDENPLVVHAAAAGVVALAPDDLESHVLRADRSRWTASHDARLFALNASWSTEGVIGLTVEASRRIEERDLGTVFDGCPSSIERAWERIDVGKERVAEIVSDLETHRDVRVRAVAARIGVGCGARSADLMVGSLTSEDLHVRASAAECIVRATDTGECERMFDVWETLRSLSTRMRQSFDDFTVAPPRSRS